MSTNPLEDRKQIVQACPPARARGGGHLAPATFIDWCISLAIETCMASGHFYACPRGHIAPSAPPGSPPDRAGASVRLEGSCGLRTGGGHGNLEVEGQLQPQPLEAAPPACREHCRLVLACCALSAVPCQPGSHMRGGHRRRGARQARAAQASHGPAKGTNCWCKPSAGPGPGAGPACHSGALVPLTVAPPQAVVSSVSCLALSDTYALRLSSSRAPGARCGGRG